MEGIQNEDLQGFKNLRNALGENSSSMINIETEVNKDQNQIQMADQNEDDDESDQFPYNPQFLNDQIPDIKTDEQELLLQELGINIDDAKPSGAQVHKALKYFDLAIKIEVTLHEMQSILILSSCIEILLYSFSILLFFKMTSIGLVWLFTPHVLKSVVGIMIFRLLPKSYQIVKQLGFDKNDNQFDDNENQYDFSKIHQQVRKNIEKQFFDTFKQCQTLLKLYAGSIYLCNILDMINIIIALSRYGKVGFEYQQMTMLFLSIIFWASNMYWVGFILQLNFKFPEYISQYLIDVFLAIGKQANERITNAGQFAKRYFDKANNASRQWVNNHQSNPNSQAANA